MRILIADDEKPIAKVLTILFEKNNYSVDTVYNGQDAYDYIEMGNYDACILDVMMPDIDGFTIVRRLRKKGIDVPILLLTAKSEIDDKVEGLDSGANYYLTKPFDTKELLATVRAITRAKNSADSKITFGNITLDITTFELSTESGSVRLSNKEFQMLECLMSQPGTVISADRFMEKIWGYDSDSDIGVIWVYISYLRKKLASVGANVHIKSSRSLGYYLEEVK